MLSDMCSEAIFHFHKMGSDEAIGKVNYEDGSEEYKMPNYYLHVCKKMISCLKERTIVAIWYIYIVHYIPTAKGGFYFFRIPGVFTIIRLGIRTYVTTRGKGDRN